jgi:glycosyltransferase involved in cell wall biosynthesis
VEKYIQTYSRTIKYFHQKNGGVSSARNLGLEKARGDFICFLDSDDFLVSNDSLSKRAKFLLKNSNIDIVTSDMEVIYELDKPRKSWLGNAGFLNFFGRNIELRRNEEIYFDEF